MTKYIINLPVYQYNTGRGDNGNTVFKFYYTDLKIAKDKLKFINKVYHQIKNNIELGDVDSDKYSSYFICPVNQISEAYITSNIETRI